ncbi:VPA1262 family N-terminal domain-containing protein [Paraburkholderia fungorum]|nr:VPA1262 family N-terminal domain-containing protein [Paraburkholderia fungorum]
MFSIVVLETRKGETASDPAFMNGRKRIELKTLPDWTFGVCRYLVELEKLAPAIEVFKNSSTWSLGGAPLILGEMASVAPQFVPPDATEPTALNRLLKNNFWNGAYVLEFFDNTKSNLQFFFEHPPRLQELSEKVQVYVPLGLAGMADRLGNIVIQLPSTVLMNQFRKGVNHEGFLAEVAWHPEAPARPLRAITSMEFDNVLCGYGSAQLQSNSADIRTNDSSGENRHLIWDDQNQLILAASGRLYYIGAFSISSTSSDPEPRVFSAVEDDGRLAPQRVMLSAPPSNRSVIGEPNRHTYREWTRRRIYKDEEERLAVERRFVQYAPELGDHANSHAKAVDDIRLLINKHGAGGVWLWDPYLSARDILDTLFYCIHSGAQLRALTDGQEPPSPRPAMETKPRVRAYFRRKALRQLAQHRGASGPTLKFIKNQRTTLAKAAGNCRGLALEYRIRTGNAGLRFHDRFLIFPNADGQALAWSLGTSVNSVGKAHHILQRVDNGRLIVDAFLRLWNQLHKSEHLIWKTP